MIDAANITNYQRTDQELEEFLLFTIAVAGKTAATTSVRLQRFLDYAHHRFPSNESHFVVIKRLADLEDLGLLMQSFGFGCWKVKSRGFLHAARSGLDLRICSVEDLEKIPGVGMKTSRFFILHSRKNAQVACLDTHVLKWLREHSCLEVPKQTPPKGKYMELEGVFLKLATVLKISPADLDLRIWVRSRRLINDR